MRRRLPLLALLFHSGLASAVMAEGPTPGLDGAEPGLGPVSGELAEVRGAFANGRIDRAAELCRALLAKSEAIHGRRHPATAAVMNDMAGILAAQGRATEAEQLYREALVIREEHYGPRHRQVALALNNLGFFLLRTGRIDEARATLERAASLWRDGRWPQDAVYAAVVLNLGECEFKAGRYENAVRHYREAVRVREKIGGERSPELAVALNNLGFALRYVGDEEGAFPMFERAVRILEQSAGSEHPELASALHNLGEAASELGRADLAEQSLRRSLAILERQAPARMSEQAVVANSLAERLVASGKKEEALALFERTVSIQERLYGPTDPALVPPLSSQVGLLIDLGRYADAEPLARRILAVEGSAPSRERGVQLANLALIFLHERKLQDAEDAARAMVGIADAVAGDDPLFRAQARFRLGQVLSAQERYQDAEQAFGEAASLRSKVLGAADPEVMKAGTFRADALCKLGRFEEARRLYEADLTSSELTFGAQHENLIMPLERLGALAERRGDRHAALAFLERAFSISNRALGPEHPTSKELKERIAAVSGAGSSAAE